MPWREAVETILDDVQIFDQAVSYERFFIQKRRYLCHRVWVYLPALGQCRRVAAASTGMVELFLAISAHHKSPV